MEKDIKHKVYLLVWLDAVAQAGWLKTDELDESHVCYTVGYLVKTTKTSYHIAATVSADEVNAVQTIPKKWVIEKRRIDV